MNTIIWCEEFQETGVEFVAHGAKYKQIRKVKGDILILRVVF